jgi:hypothetical protein
MIAYQQAQYAKQAQEQKFQQETQLKHDAARAEAEQFDYKYSQTSKREIARINQSIQDLRSDDSFSAEEKIAGERELRKQLMGITSDAVPADPNKVKYPDGQGAGTSWTDEASGALVRRGDNGQVEVVQRYDQSPKHLQEVAAAKIQAAEVTRQQVLEDSERKMEFDREAAIRKNIQETEITVPDGFEKDGTTPAFTDRLLFPAEVEAEMRSLGYGPQAKQDAIQAQQLQQMQEQQQAVNEAQMEEIAASLQPGQEYTMPDGTVLRKKVDPFPERRPEGSGRFLRTRVGR